MFVACYHFGRVDAGQVAFLPQGGAAPAERRRLSITSASHQQCWRHTESKKVSNQGRRNACLSAALTTSDRATESFLSLSRSLDPHTHSTTTSSAESAPTTTAASSSEHYGMTEGTGGRASERAARSLTVWIRASFAVLCL